MKSIKKLAVLDDFTPFRPSARAATDAAPAYTRGELALGWSCRIIAAGIMIETLFFKFTGAPESVYIFSKMNMEPWWRYGQGIWELLASVLLLTPRLGWAGGILTLGAIGAAIVSHLTILGVQIQGDGGLLFAMAWAAFVAGFIVTFIHRSEIPRTSQPLSIKRERQAGTAKKWRRPRQGVASLFSNAFSNALYIRCGGINLSKNR